MDKIGKMTNNKIPKLSQEIVANRQEKAPLLKKISDICLDFHTKIENILSALCQLNELDTRNIEKSREEINALLNELNHLKERVDIRYNRFQQGMITVSIAGLEKAGKTTFLKSLTGIEYLPAFDERCTAVCCEIHYDTGRSDFDIEFYTEHEFTDRVLKPVIETVIAELPDNFKNQMPLPVSASEFAGMKLPPLNALPGGQPRSNFCMIFISFRNIFMNAVKIWGRLRYTEDRYRSLKNGYRISLQPGISRINGELFSMFRRFRNILSVRNHRITNSRRFDLAHRQQLTANRPSPIRKIIFGALIWQGLPQSRYAGFIHRLTAVLLICVGLIHRV